MKDALLGASHGAEVTVLARPEVFLVPADGRQLCGDLVERLLQGGRLLGRGALFLWQLGAVLVFDLDCIALLVLARNGNGKVKQRTRNEKGEGELGGG